MHKLTQTETRSVMTEAPEPSPGPTPAAQEATVSPPAVIPPAPVPDLSADSIRPLPQLTGSWLGARSYLSDRGVTFVFEYTSFFQGLVSGTEIEGSEYGGKADALVNLDTGKINPLDLLASEPFLGGWGTRRFMNLVFAAPPSGLVPPVFKGAVGNIKTEHVSWTIMVFDPNDRTTEYFPDDLFADGVSFSVTATHPSQLAARDTTYSLTTNFTTSENLDYSALPPGIGTGTTKGGAYNVAFQFTHTLQKSAAQPEATWGFYLRAAIADGNSNYVKASMIAGIGGKALFAGRPQDDFGIGAFYYNLSDELEDSLDSHARFGNEAAIEAYYSLSVTPWLYVGGDIQYFHPARRDRKNGVFAALRTNIRS